MKVPKGYWNVLGIYIVVTVITVVILGLFNNINYNNFFTAGFLYGAAITLTYKPLLNLVNRKKGPKNKRKETTNVMILAGRSMKV